MKILRMLAIFLIFSLGVFLISDHVFAGKLFIKADLELSRARRLIEQADTDYRMAKIHMGLSPEIAVKEFESAKSKYSQARDLIEKYGVGYYTPGDLEDLDLRGKECGAMIQQCNEALESKK